MIGYTHIGAEVTQSCVNAAAQSTNNFVFFWNVQFSDPRRTKTARPIDLNFNTFEKNYTYIFIHHKYGRSGYATAANSIQTITVKITDKMPANHIKSTSINMQLRKHRARGILGYSAFNQKFS
jgi:hypothetical protein